MSDIRVTLEDPGTDDARPLIAELDAYQEALYPAESNHLLPIESLRRTEVTFLVLRVDGVAVGCGAVLRQEDYAELKRMFIRPSFRGRKLGRRLLDELETLARAASLRIVRLETGIHQPEALALYERAGYRRRGPFGAYGEDPLSVFFEKRLDG